MKKREREWEGGAEGRGEGREGGEVCRKGVHVYVKRVAKTQRLALVWIMYMHLLLQVGGREVVEEKVYLVLQLIWRFCPLHRLLSRY